MYVKWIGPGDSKVLTRRSKDYFFETGKWVFVTDLLLLKEIYNEFRGSVFEMTDHEFEPLMKVKDSIVLLDDGLIMTADASAITVLEREINFVKLQAVKGPNRIYKVIGFFGGEYEILSQREIKKLLAFRRLGGWGDVQMVISALTIVKRANPELGYIFSAPGPYHRLAENNPYISRIVPYHKFHDAKNDADITIDLTRPCIRREIKEQPNVDANRTETFAKALQYEEEIPRAVGFYLSQDEALKYHSRRRAIKKPTIGLCPRSCAPVRNWSEKGFVELADRFRQWGAKVIVIDKQLPSSFPENTYDNTANMEVRDSAILMHECDLVVGIDTGPMHTAAVQRVPTLWLFSHIDGDVRTKNYPEAEVIQHKKACVHSPCWYKIPCGGEKTKMPDCMKPITVDAIFDRAVGMLEQPFLSWVIVGWNKLHLTQQCIEHIRRIKKWSHEIIFVDNGSSDNTPDWCRSQPDIEYFRMDDNLGCVLGRDFGMRQAKGKFILTLDNDQYVGPRFLNQLYQIPADVVGVEAWSMKKAGYAFRVEDSGKPMYYVGGGGLLFPREAAEKVDFLDKNFAPAWFSDVDFTRKLVEAGYSVSYVVNADVQHLGHRTVFAQEAFNHKEAWQKSHKYFMSKWGKELQVAGH